MASERNARLKSYLQSLAGGGVFETLGGSDDLAEGLTGFETLESTDKFAVEGVAAKLGHDEELSPEEEFALEAIIIPDRRPAVLVRNDSYEITHKDWLHFNDPEVRACLEPAIPAVGRVEVPGHPRLPYAGTAFLVAPGIVMTNRHVAELLADGLGRHGLMFKPGFGREIGFAREVEREGEAVEILEPLLIHPWWDLALMRIAETGLTPLTLDPDAENNAHEVAVIGYAAFDPRNSEAVQHRVFEGVYDVKRLQPGHLKGRATITHYKNAVESLRHDASTLGGNSGSAVLDVVTGHVAALHFGGRYLQTNYAVPVADMARDARLVDAGIFEAAAARPADGPWQEGWSKLEPGPAIEAQPGVQAAAPVPAPAGAVALSGPRRVQIPITITIDIGAANAG